MTFRYALVQLCCPATCPAIWLCTVLLQTLALADGVLVVTDDRHPVRAPGNVRVIKLDEPARLKAELASGLAAVPARSASIARRRLAENGAALHHRFRVAYQDVIDAWSLGVITVPAVVVDRRYVVYGESDIDSAIDRIERYRRAQP